MNERIKQLVEQSGAGWDDKYHWYVSSETMQKLGELIVLECAEVADINAVEAMGLYGKVLEHFGIEV